MTSFVNEGVSRSQPCQPYQLLKIFRYDLGSMMSRQKMLLDHFLIRLCFDDSAEFNNQNHQLFNLVLFLFSLNHIYVKILFMESKCFQSSDIKESAVQR